jgi:ATP-dependent RNA helicase DDX47/RRP3
MSNIVAKYKKQSFSQKKPAKKVIEVKKDISEIDNNNNNNNDEDENILSENEDTDLLSNSVITSVSFESLGVVKPLCDAIASIGWKSPTEIQRGTIPEALLGKDVIGLAETGSGKTGAFAIPILQALLANPQRLFAVILAPTRELAFQINEVFDALGSTIALHSACIVGGIDMVTQAITLAKKPHVIVATPGRLVDHLQNTKGFSLRTLKYLVMDEADRMLSMDFEEEINTILAAIPRERRTFLFSATMTSKVAKLQKASLVDPIKCEVSSKFQTPRTLVQQYLFIPSKWKDCYLAYLLDEYKGQSTIIFVATCKNALRTTLMLRNLGFKAVCLHGQLSQPKRLGALNKFKAGERNILVATDVASRGLDIPDVDLVLNYDIPSNGKDYVHRVGRTARAGKSGRSVAFVTQYDVEAYQRLEALINQKLPQVLLF